MSLRLQPVDLDPKGWELTIKQQNNEEAGEVSLSEVLATPIEKLTEVAIDGAGAFDVLMRATKLHLKEEYEASRITGKEYSTVYLGALTAVLQTATQFLLNEQQVFKLSADIGLVRQQIVTELAQTDDNIPKGLGYNFIPNETTPISPVPAPAP
jgi:hypothetical protein